MPPTPLRIAIGCVFIAGAWFTRRQARNWLRAMQGAQPHRARAFRIESGLLDVLCVAMLVVGLGFIIA